MSDCSEPSHSLSFYISHDDINIPPIQTVTTPQQLLSSFTTCRETLSFKMKNLQSRLQQLQQLTRLSQKSKNAYVQPFKQTQLASFISFQPREMESMLLSEINMPNHQRQLKYTRLSAEYHHLQAIIASMTSKSRQKRKNLQSKLHEQLQQLTTQAEEEGKIRHEAYKLMKMELEAAYGKSKVGQNQEADAKLIDDLVKMVDSCIQKGAGTVGSRTSKI